MKDFLAHARPYFPYLRRYRGRIAALAALMLGASTLEGVGIGLFYPLIQYMQDGPAFLSHGAGLIVARVLASVGLRPSVGAFIAAIFVVIASALLLKYWVFVTSARVYDPLMKDLRDEAFRRTLSSHIFVFTSGSSASLAQTLENEVDYVGHAFNFTALIAASGLSLAVYGACAVFVSWRLTVLVGVLGVLRYLVSGAFVSRIHAEGHEHGRLRVALKSRLTALHQGIDVVKSFGSEDREQRRFEGLTSLIDENDDRIARTKAINAFSEGMLGEGLLCIVIYAAVSRLSVSGATLLTFLFVVSRIIPKIAAINDARVHLAEFLSKTERLPVVLSHGGLPALRWGGRKKDSFDAAVVFEGVSFRYPETGADAVSGVDLKLEKRRTLALVGESGSGKSTVTRLLLRLFDPTQGRVLVDGVPLPELRREDWTRLISVVSQDTFVFDDTLEANVRYGAPDCTEERFREALRLSRADEFAERLPLKEKTEIGERGVRLSGGQRQRLAIARAFLRDSPILILDEATSAMDSITEGLIQEALRELAKDRTLLVIAHRLSTVRDASRIAVLDKGRVAEAGTHAELLAAGGLYRRYHDLQAR
ncbi:MAG: ABC transporter ATP-binding protein [Elusimicrobiota bacterium]